MALDKFKKIEELKGQFVPDNELEIFGKDPIRTSFGRWKNDTLRVIIYDGSNTPVEQKGYGYVRYINQKDFPQYYKKIEGETRKSTRRYEIDVRAIVKDSGYNIGIFTIEIMFINSRLGSEKKPNRVWIQEISPSRTEVRILPFDLSESPYVIGGIPISDIIDERYNAFLDYIEFKEDIWESIDDFLDKITTENVRNALLNRVGTRMFNKILKEYFRRSIPVFEDTMYKVLDDFKKAVRAEIENIDSLIGYGYNKRNPNFTIREYDRERVVIDFPKFCLDTLYVSLDVNVVEYFIFKKTELTEDVIARDVTQIIPDIEIPDYRPLGTRSKKTTDPDPESPPPDPSNEPPPEYWTFDRGQGTVTIGLWSNLPKIYSPVIDFSTGKVEKYELTPQSELLDPRNTAVGALVSVQEFDPTGHPRHWGFELPELYKHDWGLVVPKDPSWIPRQPIEDKDRWDIESRMRYDDWFQYIQSGIYKYRGRWSDSETLLTVPRSIERPTIPGDSDLDFITSYPNCIKTGSGMMDIMKYANNNVNVDYPLPAYYLKSNNGPEKTIKVFKNNNVVINLPDASFETRVRFTWNSYSPNSFDAPSAKFKSVEDFLNWTYSLDPIDWNRTYNAAGGFGGYRLITTNRIMKGMTRWFGDVQGSGGNHPEIEVWVFDGIYNWDTGELITKGVGNYTEIILKNIQESINLFIKYKRVNVQLLGTIYRGAYSIEDGIYSTECSDTDASVNIGNYGWVTTVYPLELEKEYGYQSPLSFQESQKYTYPVFPSAWQNRKSWWDIASITNPLKGGLYKSNLNSDLTSFLSEAKNFDKFQ